MSPRTVLILIIVAALGILPWVEFLLILALGFAYVAAGPLVRAGFLLVHARWNDPDGSRRHDPGDRSGLHRELKHLALSDPLQVS
jgi:hypothetical protein